MAIKDTKDAKDSKHDKGGHRPEDEPHKPRNPDNPMQELVYSPETPISAGGNVPIGEGAIEREQSHVAGGFDPHVRVKEERDRKLKEVADPKRHGGAVEERDLSTDQRQALNESVPENLGPLDREKWKFKRLHDDKESVSVPKTWLQEAIRELHMGGTNTRRPELVSLLQEKIDEKRGDLSGKTASEQVAGTPPNETSIKSPSGTQQPELDRAKAASPA